MGILAGISRVFHHAETWQEVLIGVGIIVGIFAAGLVLVMLLALGYFCGTALLRWLLRQLRAQILRAWALWWAAAKRRAQQRNRSAS